MDKYRIDSHKLIYHIRRVNDWLLGKNIYPIYIEISPSGTCNHRCTYCALDYMEYQPNFLDIEMLKERVSEISFLGVKSIMYAGEGEPLLRKGIGEIINHTKQCGIDVALTTNGVFLKESLAKEILGNMSWIKVSVSGGTKETYGMIHRTNSNDFDKVMKNITYAVNIKKENGYSCIIGIQFLLLPENSHELSLLIQKAKDIGLDYVVIKPYSHHLFSKTTKYKDIQYSKYLEIADKLQEFNDENFSVIFRANTMKKWDESARMYKRCNAFPFWCYIDASGSVWGCSAYLGDNRFLYGNIYQNKFQEIWEGEVRQKILDMIQNQLDINQCRVNCRMDEINRYLWELRNPPLHVNFI